MSSNYELLYEEGVEDTKDAERALVRRLDRRLLAFAMLGNVIKVLDNTNLANAYISGLEEGLGLQLDGNCFQLWISANADAFEYDIITYAAICVPADLGSDMVPINQDFGRKCIYDWKLETCGAMINPIKSFVRGTIFLLGSWYTREELGARNALFAMCGTVGTMASGLLQAALLETMDGALGISGWRWTFIIDASFTAVLAYFGFKYLPDYPGSGTSWLSEEEHKVALRRLAREGKGTTKGSFFSKETMTGLFGTWPLYIFVIAWVSLHISMGSTAVLGIVARKSGYDAVTSNLFTTPSTLLNIITVVANGFLSDRLRTRKWCIVYPALLGVVGYCMLSAFVQPFGLLWVGFVLIHAGLGCTNSIVMTWLNEIVVENQDIRAMTIAIMNTLSQLSQMVTNLVLWPVTDAPKYHVGFTACIFFVIIYIIAVLWIGHLQQTTRPIYNNNPIVVETMTDEIYMEDVTKATLLSDTEENLTVRDASLDRSPSSSITHLEISKTKED
ncbi:hypothetical protein INT43_000627 [Umbelopsis isabellina]|uniref:Major facilitator superfamily (MFS) profile domain-containing protein n=1 Tax=Mortierella isabellina TaxID=91625 RepID=A0A8H7Q452_MORIS|nr:hypothetical protein INT43_000627 [Umbelopsis isabellina]